MAFPALTHLTHLWEISAWARRHSCVCLQTCTVDRWLGSLNTSLQTPQCSCKSKGTTGHSSGGACVGESRAPALVLQLPPGPASTQLPGGGKGKQKFLRNAQLSQAYLLRVILCYLACFMIYLCKKYSRIITISKEIQGSLYYILLPIST